MLAVVVVIPGPLRQYAENASEVQVEAVTVDEALRKLDERYPSLRSFIVDEKHSLRRYVNIFVNEDNVRSGDGLGTKLKDGDRVQIIPAVAGG